MVSLEASDSLLVSVDALKNYQKTTRDTTTDYDTLIKAATTKVEVLLNRQIRRGRVEAITRLYPLENFVVPPWEDGGLSVTKDGEPVSLDEFYTNRFAGTIGPLEKTVLRTSHIRGFNTPDSEHYHFVLQTGWGSADLPDEIKLEIMEMARDLYLNRGRRIAKDSKIIPEFAMYFRIPNQHIPDWRVC